MTATRQPKTEVQAKPVSYLSTRHVFKTLRLLIACENPEACRTIASILNKMRFSKVLMRGKSDTIHFQEGDYGRLGRNSENSLRKTSVLWFMIKMVSIP